MKFRAKTTDVVFIRTFSQLLSSLSRCSRDFVLRITSDKLIFVLSDKEQANASTAISAWGEVPKDPYFCEYAMEGVSAEANEIYLEISPEKIAGCLSALRANSQAVALKIKLTKKVVPCLTFEIEFSLGINSAPTCVHDVPISLVIRKYWPMYAEPCVPDFDISVGMPEIKIVRLALDRMKNLGPKLLITGYSDGKVHFSVESYNVKSTVKFGDLRIFNLDGPDGSSSVHMADPDRDPSEVKKHSVEVDMKTLNHVISSDLHKPSNFILSLCGATRLHLYFLYGDITLQYILPNVGDAS